MKYYEIRKEVEYGCTIYSIYDKELNVRVNHYGNFEDAQKFAERQDAARARRVKNDIQS